MNLQGRNLSVDMQGDDVRLLRFELTLLGYNIPQETGSLQSAVIHRFDEAVYQAVQAFQKAQGLEATGVVDEITARAINARVDEQFGYIVRGRATQVGGAPVAFFTVRAFDKDMRGEELLGETKTDLFGRYEIHFHFWDFATAEASWTDARPDLVVRVYALNPDQPLVSSEILFNAEREETVDLLIPADQRLSEYERYMQQLAQPMGDVPLEALTEEDITFLSGDTRIERQHINWLAESARAALNINQLDLGQPSRQVMETVFYGWFRDNQPRQFRELIRRSTDLLTSSLENAIQELYIPALSSEIKDQLRRLLDKLRIEEALKPAPERETASLGDVLNILPAHLILDSNQRTAVVKIIDEGLNTEKSLAERLEEAGLHHQQIWAVERIVNLQSLSKNHLPLIQALQLDEVDENAASLRDLVSMDTSDWRKLTAMHGAPVSIEGEDEAQRQTLYAEQLAASIENTYPSEWVAHRIQHDRFPVESSAKEGLQTFFQKNPKFQLGKTSAFQYFNNSENIVLEGVSDELMVKEEVFKLERIVHCSPRLEFAAKILENGFGSAQAIASVSRERFKKVTALENPEWTKQADETYARALQANAKAAVIATEYIRAEKGAPIAIMQPRQQPASVNRAIAVSNQTADLHTLFGNLDFCECEHCSSVYSPAAYLVDLLQVLDGGARNGQQESPLDALLKRRPDLVETDFTCENTNTAIPYIDLVLESLENAIEKKGSGAMRVGPRDDAALDRKVLPAKLKDDINSWGISITDKASISILPQDLNGRKRWLLRDQDWKIHLVGLLNASAYAVLVWPQTHGSAEALQAVPHYVFPQPYSVLKQSYFPWRLPFDLWWEETRIWLKQLDVERCALMETFAGENRYADFSIAIEYLNFSKSEADQLTVPIDGWSLWGFDSNSDITSSIKDPIGGGSFIPKAPDKTWAGALNQRASLLRHRAGLTQRELMNLLETKFVQGSSQIRLSGDECDVGKMSLTGLDAPALIRIHLFVRLWRKLGWSMPDVDRILQAFPQAFNSIDSVFNPGFLIFIANVERLRKKTGLPLGVLLNWYTPTLSTQQYANFSRSPARILPSTYEEFFYDRSVAHPKDSAFELNSDRNEVLPANPSETIRSKISLIAAALGVKPNQLEVLLPLVKDGLTLAESDLTDAVNLANLSALSRYTSLAKALHISTKDLLLLIDLTGINPFSNPENTLLLFDRLQFIKIAGCSLADLDYLLRHKSPGQSNLALPESKSITVLTEIRKILQQIRQETTAGIDERGEITRKWLAYLQWPAELIDEILSTDFLGLESVAADYDANHLPQGIELPDTMRYDRPTRRLITAGQDKNTVIVDLENLIQAAQNTNLVPALKRLENQIQQIQNEPIQTETTFEGINFPAGVNLPSAIYYEEASKRLVVTEKVTGHGLAAVKDLTNDQAFRKAIDKLSSQVKTAVDGVLIRMHSFRLPVHTIVYEQTPPLIPQSWTGRFYYQPAQNQFAFEGLMTERDKEALLQLDSNNIDYKNAVEQLYQAGKKIPESPEFIDQAIAEKLFFDSRTPRERFSIVLARLLNHARKQLQRQRLTDSIATAFGFNATLSESLLGKLSYQNQPLFPILTEENFTNSDAKVVLTPGGFEKQFKALELLYKAGVLINRLNFSAKQTDWLFDNTWTGLPDFSRLPLQAIAGGNQFEEWVNLALIAQTRRKFPEGEITLEKLAGLLNQNSAPTWNDSFQQALADRFNWPEADFKLLISTEGLNFSGIDDLRSPQKLNQLADCLALILKLGSAAEMAINWKKEELAAQDAAAARQLVRSRYDQAIWYQLAPALQNKLRQKRRAALLDYLIAKENARDANDLFGKYLIDPEMGDCMTTTRILQASSTVQLFIQRCLMGLESEKEIVNGQEIELGVSPAAIDKERWQWMKNYRVWEANRKVFFYPENWIEPELRDDKSLFFQELESELLQGDITNEKAESALRNYLTKLDEVSRLEVVGMYRDTPKAGDGRLKYGFETLHVFGRTYTDPRKYFFRTYQKLGFAPAEGNWTAWQRVNLDFEGANLLYPIVWQQKIYLFWLSFIEKAEEKIPEKGTLPNKFWEFRLNWSVFENEKWQVKKVFPIDGLKIPISNTVLKSSFVLKGQKKLDNFRFGLIGPVPAIDDAFVTRKLSQINFDGYSVNKLNDLLFANIIGSVKGPEILISEDSIISLDGLGMIFDNSSSQRRIIKPHQDIEQRNEFRAPSLLNSNSEKEVFNLNGSAAHFVISDSQKSSFLGYPYWETLEFEGRKYDLAKILFFTLYHPQTARFQRSLLESGLKSMLQLENQNDAQATKVFDDLKPSLETISQVNRPNLNVDFSSNGAYSQYNWELFFHLPFIVAAHLAKNQRFEEARQWFHYIFDPTDDSQEPEPARFWRFRPFHENARTTPIQQLAKILTTEDALLTQEERQEKQNFDLQVRQWLANPFKPHAVARWRNRAYMFSVVMKYLDNLIAWGDQLFRRDTRESLNEALQIYMLAAQILGRKPESIPRRTRPITQSFSDVKGKLDKLSNILVAAENVLGPSDSPGQVNTPLAAMPSLLFCVPENPKILEYHDKVADRLFKLRNCMNIDGVKRQLALFDPPIDPAILVKAAAAGIDISTVLNDLNAPTPLYRFNIMVQKATELCSEVKNLGGLLLASLEKRDAEELSLIRSQHEIRLLEQQRQIKELQREETKASSNALSESLKAAEAKQKYYSDLLSAIEEMEDFSIPNGPAGQLVDLIRIAIKDTGIPAEIVGKVENFIGNIKSDGKKILNETLTSEKTPMIPVEKRQLEELKLSHDLQERAKAYQNVAQMTSMLPDVTIGIQGVSSSPVIQAQIGGSLLSKIAQLQGSFIEYESSEHAYRANLHSILAGYQRRATDWKYQENLAKLEYDQISEQIAAAALRETIVNKELLLIEKQIENAQLVEDFMRNKYANQELYDWMAGQISNTYFQSYQLAYDMAKRAEKAYRFELGLQDSDSNFIQFGYWDNLKKGLLAGEKLHHDLKRMELAYLDQNRREYELTKHISLRQLNPAALLFFRATGLCEFEIPEWLYDLDCPGHYMRRIKSVSLSIPCVAGPYTGINCALSLQKSALRISPTNPDEYGRTGGEDGRFKNYYGAIQSIVASNAQNDSGLFELNFRDERFLPFEGAGAISSWKLELPGELRQFDYQTIADVILHIRYTSRPGSESLITESVRHFKTLLKTDYDTEDKTKLTALFSLKHDFPNEWNKTLAGGTPFIAKLRKEHFPYFAQPFDIELKKAARWTVDGKSVSSQESVSFTEGEISDQNKELALSVGNLGNGEIDVFLLLNYTLQ